MMVLSWLRRQLPWQLLGNFLKKVTHEEGKQNRDAGDTEPLEVALEGRGRAGPSDFQTAWSFLMEGLGRAGAKAGSAKPQV